MGSTRKIILRGSARIVEGRISVIGFTKNNARYEVVVNDLDDWDVRLLMHQCAEFLQRSIESEQSKHKSIREVARAAFARIAALVDKPEVQP